MKRFNDSEITLLLLAFVLALILTPRIANADFTFGTATNLGPTVNSPDSDFSTCISADGLSLFFSSNRPPGGWRDFDLWVTTRQTKDEDWGAAVHLGDTLNSRGMEWTPCISADGLELFFGDGTWGDTDISVARRNSPSEPWGAAQSLGPTVNSTAWDSAPSISADGLELFFSSTRSGGFGGPDLYVTTRASTSDPWGPAVNLGPTINSAYGDSLYGEWTPNISQDGLTLFFASARPPGSASNLDIWMTRRATGDDEWGPLVHLGAPVNSSSQDSSPCISADGLTLYFVSGRPGGVGGDSDFWQAAIIPIVDFNADGIVDLKDFSELAQYWQENERSVDIAPPIGNGIVDIRDVAVLADYWLKEIGLLAHWKLDETEGALAHDSSGDKHGTVQGHPTWEPTAGKVGGAVRLDGVDDYVSTPFVLSPAEGPFSVFAWVKGGAGPGQVIISQQNGANWLGTDPFNFGWLMSDLQVSGGRSLFSQKVITDGEWHRVGLVWDGENRILYVDGIEVAKDTQTSLAGSDGGLYFGAGKNLQPGSFWSGLIDDIKIYDRAVRP